MFTPRRSIIVVRISVVVVFLYIADMVITAVPIQVDESIQYHPIACDFYNNAEYHTFWNPCDSSTNLNLLGIQLKRAYQYVGGFSSYVYYPFFRLYPSILTQRLVGLIFLIALVGTLTLLEPENKLSVVVLFGLSFPLIYQLANDTGPVRYGLFIGTFTPWFVGRITRLKRKPIKIVLNIVLGVLLFLAVEDKPFFLYLVPSVFLLTLAYNYKDAQHGEPLYLSLRRTDAGPRSLLSVRAIAQSFKFIVSEMLIALIVFSTLTYLYLIVAKTNSGQSYLSELMGFVKPVGFIEQLKSILSFMTNFEKFSSDVYEIRQFKLLNRSLSLVIWLSGLILLAKAYQLRPGSLPGKMVCTALAFIVSIFVMLLMRNASTGHHYIFPYMLALLLVCQSMSYVKLNQYPFLIVYGCFAVVIATELLFLVPSPASSWERYKMFEYLKRENIARNYVFVHLSLGTYYVASLYGHKDQLSIQIRSLDRETAGRIISLAGKVKRKIACVCRIRDSVLNNFAGDGLDCDPENLSNKFLNRIKFKEVNLQNGDWKLYVQSG